MNRVGVIVQIEDIQENWEVAILDRNIKRGLRNIACERNRLANIRWADFAVYCRTGKFPV